MRDRISTQVLANGAIRYAVYDEQGNFLRYEYLLPADEPTDAGTPLNKATLLTDETAEALGLEVSNTSDPTVDEALAKLRQLVSTVQAGVDNGVKISTGSYIGTGTAGADNPCSLTFEFNPKLLIVQRITLGSPAIILALYGVSQSYTAVLGTTFQQARLTWGDKTVSWYTISSDAGAKSQMQLNQLNTEYAYFAIA